MNKSEMATIFAAMSGNWNIDFNDNTKKNLWFTNLCDLDYNTILLAIKKLIQNLQFPPTIAHIREAYFDILKPKIQTTDILNLINDMTTKFGRYRVLEALEYAKEKDPLSYKIIKAIGFLNICNGNINFIRPEIERLHTEAAKNYKQDEALTTDVKVAIADLRSQLYQHSLKLEECYSD